MGYHVVLSSTIDLVAITQAAERGERPRHALVALAAELSARIVQPADTEPGPADKLLSRLIGAPRHWALARALRRQLGAGDVVYCSDESVGLPVMAMCARRHGPKIMVFTHNARRPRVRFMLTLLERTGRQPHLMTVCKGQSDFLRRAIGIAEDRLLTIWDQSDTCFFRPAGSVAGGHRPLLMSVGLEQRDYRTLAAATEDLDVDVRISGYSSNAKVYGRTFPETLPANMTRERYDWPDLLALYQRADIAVVSLFPNDYAAGIQVLLEAIACGTPVIVTRTEGLAEYLVDTDMITVIPAGDIAAMRRAVIDKLADPRAARRHAARARERYLPVIDSARYNREIADRLRALA